MLPKAARPLGHILQIAKRYQQIIFVDVQRLIGLHAHNGQVDRPQAQLRQNAREDGWDAARRVQKPRDQSGEHTGQDGGQERYPHVAAACNQHYAHGAPGAEGTVHRQVGNVQQLIGNIEPNGHNAPDQPLGNGAGQRVEKT